MAKRGSDEWRARISESRRGIGRPHTAETKQKIAAAKRGPLNPRWKGDGATPQAGRARAESMHVAASHCERCDKRRKTERHHKDGNTLNNERSNIRFLCRRCHMTEDGRLQQLRCRNGRTGTKQSPETIAKRVASLKARWSVTPKKWRRRRVTLPGRSTS